MQQLNKLATAIFCNLIDTTVNGYIKLFSDPFMPLTIEKIGEAITPFGDATLYSLCHYYEQNGDLMQDPEMCFALVDKRTSKIDYENARVYPYMFQQANIGKYEVSGAIDNDGWIRATNTELQIDHMDFANFWMENLQAQGFIK